MATEILSKLWRSAPDSGLLKEISNLGDLAKLVEEIEVLGDIVTVIAETVEMPPDIIVGVRLASRGHLQLRSLATAIDVQD